MDKEQALQVQRAREHGYQWARDHAEKFRACAGMPEATVWLAREMPLPRAMGRTPREKFAQSARILRAAMDGAFSFARRAKLELLPF